VPDGLTAAAWQSIQSQVAKLTAADGAADDAFGGSVSVSGDTAVAGACNAAVGGNPAQGAAYVFYRNQGGPDAWGWVAKLTADDGVAGDCFGSSVSVSGDTAVVGAEWADAGLGAAYVFYRDQGGADTWGQVVKIPADGELFGCSVSVSGDTAVVGAYWATVGGNQWQGAAHVFYRDQGGPDAWGWVAMLTAADGAEYDEFGYSVSVSGDTAVVGAVLADVGLGAAYVFYRDQGASDAWGQVAKLTAADGAAGDCLGSSVSVSGDTAVVGAQDANVGGNNSQGTAYVFYRDQGGADAWGQVAKLTAADGGANDNFGASVSVSGDTAVVGAHAADIGGNDDQGAAYVFHRNQGGADAWGKVAKLTAADGAADDWFGQSISVSGDTAVVGAMLADVGGNVNQGAAYVFAPPPAAPPLAVDDAYCTAEDTPLEVLAALGVLANDTDPNGAPLTAVLDSGPSHGTLDLHADGSFAYTSTIGFSGVDTFTYHANDGALDSNIATARITVPCYYICLPVAFRNY